MLPHWSLPPSLEGAAVEIVKLQKVERLKQHVAELGVGDAFLAIHARAHRVFRQHVVHREVLAHVAQEIHHRDHGQPVGVVDDARRVGAHLEIQELRQLRPDLFQICCDAVLALQLTFLALAARVADQAGAAACQHDRVVSEALQPRQSHQRQEVPDLQAVGCGIKADVGRHFLAGEDFWQPFGAVVDQAAPLKFVENVRHGVRSPSLIRCASSASSFPVHSAADRAPW